MGAAGRMPPPEVPTGTGPIPVADLREGWTAATVRAAEAVLLDAGEPLMRRAAGGLARELARELASSSASRIVVLAGSGDNGGDGLYAVAELSSTSAGGAATGPSARGTAADHPDVWIIPTGRNLHEAAADAALRSGARLASVADLPRLVEPGRDVARPRGGRASIDPESVRDDGPVPAHDDECLLVLDAMVGIGATGAVGLRGEALAAAAAIRRAADRGHRIRTVAVDLPSGLQPDTGAADRSVLPADVTVTFGAVKAGLLQGRGPELAGELRLIDIGIGRALGGIPLVRRR